MSNEYISTTEAASELGITRQRVLQLINQGRLEASRLGNTFMISKTALAGVAERTPGRPKKEGAAAVATVAKAATVSKPTKRASMATLKKGAKKQV